MDGALSASREGPAPGERRGKGKGGERRTKGKGGGGRGGGRSGRGRGGGDFGGGGGGAFNGGDFGGGGGDEPDEASVFVGNLSFDVTWRELKDFAKEAGEVARADVKTGQDGRSRGFGIVQFAKAEDAAWAIENLTDTELMGRAVFLRADGGEQGWWQGRRQGRRQGGGKRAAGWRAWWWRQGRWT